MDGAGSGVWLPARVSPLVLHMGQVHQLGDHLEACWLSSMAGKRPWDDDPGRTPFYSDPRPRPQAAGADGICGRSGSPPARVRPTSGGESAA